MPVGYPPAAPRTKQRPINATRKTHTDIHAHNRDVSTHVHSLSLFNSLDGRSPLTRETRIPLPETRDTATDTPTESCFSYLLSPLLPSPLHHTLSMKPSLLGHGYIDIPTSSSYSVSLSLFLLYISFFFYYYVESTVIPTSMHFLSRFSNFSVDADSNTVISMLRRVCTVYIWWKKVSRDG